jgi:hypothetical protein
MCLTPGCRVLPVCILWAGWMEECRAREIIARARVSASLTPGMAWQTLKLGAVALFLGKMPELRQLTFQARFLRFPKQGADLRLFEYELFMLWTAGYFVEEYPTSLHAGWMESWGGVDVRGGVRDIEEQVTFTVEIADEKDKAVAGSCERPVKVSDSPPRDMSISRLMVGSTCPWTRKQSCGTLRRVGREK